MSILAAVSYISLLIRGASNRSSRTVHLLFRGDGVAELAWRECLTLPGVLILQLA